MVVASTYREIKHWISHRIFLSPPKTLFVGAYIIKKVTYVKNVDDPSVVFLSVGYLIGHWYDPCNSYSQSNTMLLSFLHASDNTNILCNSIEYVCSPPPALLVVIRERYLCSVFRALLLLFVSTTIHRPLIIIAKLMDVLIWMIKETIGTGTIRAIFA